MPVIKDSGKRRAFGTGSVRDTDEGKGAFHLLGFHALLRLAEHTRRGGEKYGYWNWQKGQPVASYLNSGIRHALEYIAGYRDEPHLDAALWNFHCAVETEELVHRGHLPRELLDHGGEGFYSLPRLRPQSEEPIPTEHDDRAEPSDEVLSDYMRWQIGRIRGFEEVGQALSKICRFAGRIGTFYSVLAHSWVVAAQLPAEIEIYGLLHDA
ncbi:MAG: DUF5664 domain-containing protein, partial [Armatimonadota bacterium]